MPMSGSGAVVKECTGKCEIVGSISTTADVLSHTNAAWVCICQHFRFTTIVSRELTSVVFGRTLGNGLRVGSYHKWYDLSSEVIICDQVICTENKSIVTESLKGQFV